ncbi:hypothetical protein [Marinobacter similis]|uniref:Uncharacterized protein n=1 Tax=Marinobacter similis TaxID=1420916 RepID=W5YM35_9GAMM|nr:hypothetical protein [Marinobacter similis]AHI29939.1 hypothetical protein AU14_01900 [Marinobacter similis]
MGIVNSPAKLIMGYPQTCTEIQEDIAAIGNWLSKIAQRISWIERFERQDVLQFGDQKAIAALDDEQRELALVEGVLLARRSKLHKELTQTKAAESIANANRIKSNITKLVNDFAELEAQIDYAKAALDRSINSLQQAAQRNNCSASKLDRNAAERVALIKFGRSNLPDVAAERQRFVRNIAQPVPTKEKQFYIRETAGIS